MSIGGLVIRNAQYPCVLNFEGSVVEAKNGGLTNYIENLSEQRTLLCSTTDFILETGLMQYSFKIDFVCNSITYTNPIW
jgi:hypothetical protein